MAQDLQHPLYKRDRAIVDTLSVEEPTDYNLAELARLRIRYRNFPGAKDIQADLDKVLQKWNLIEEALFEKTSQIHSKGQIYQAHTKKREEEDWS